MSGAPRHRCGVNSPVDVRAGQAAAPIFDKMSEDHDDVIFCKVDIDDEDLGDLVAAAQVRAVPTYTFTKSGETVADNVQGADMEAIRDVLLDQS